jgi:hypothetical protein
MGGGRCSRAAEREDAFGLSSCAGATTGRYTAAALLSETQSQTWDAQGCRCSSQAATKQQAVEVRILDSPFSLIVLLIFLPK